MFLKKAVVISIAGAVLLSGSAAYAAGEKTVTPDKAKTTADHVNKTLTPEQKKQKLIDQASKLGIDTEGKSDDEIRALIKQKLAEAAKQKRANMDKPIQAAAAKLGIEPAGKTNKELIAEVRKKQKSNQEPRREAALKKLQNEAAKLGIAAEGKTVKELMQEIRAKHKELGAQKRSGKNK